MCIYYTSVEICITLWFHEMHFSVRLMSAGTWSQVCASLKYFYGRLGIKKVLSVSLETMVQRVDHK